MTREQLVEHLPALRGQGQEPAFGNLVRPLQERAPATNLAG